MSRAASTLGNSLLALVFPQECQICRGPVEAIGHGVACGDCWSTTRIFDGSESLCTKCGAVLAVRSGDLAANSCRQCEKHSYSLARAVGVYEKAIAAAVLHLKREPWLPAILHGHIVAALSRSGLLDSTSIIPVPLSKKRLFERGFNQAEIIGSFISKQTRIPLDTASLRRRKNTPMHRVGMDERARELTVEGAFEVVGPRRVRGETILLVDDVFTSGSTASACAALLKKNGAREVNVFTLARAVMTRSFQ
jgi:ComF family protein